MSRAERYSQLESVAKRAMSPRTGFADETNVLAEYHAAAKPSVILMLIADLRAAERALLAKRKP